MPTAWVGGFDSQTPDGEGGRVGQVEGALVQANLNQVYVACADLTGTIEANRFLGRSLIASPYGEPLAGPLPAAGAGVAMAEVSAEGVREAQDRGGGISPRIDRRTDVYDLSPAVPQSTACPPAPRPVTSWRRCSASAATYLTCIEPSPRETPRSCAKTSPSSALRSSPTVHWTWSREGIHLPRNRPALGTPRSHLVAHMRAAIAAGATEEEILETLELVLPPVGVPRFIEAIAAYEQAFPTADPTEPKGAWNT